MATGNMRKPSAAPEIRRQLSKRVTVQVKQPVTPRQSEAVRVGRKAMPYVAICLFFVTFVVFMWVVPCNWGGCPSMCSQTRIKSWQTALRGMELKGGMETVPGLGGRTRNLVFMARCRVFPGELEDDTESDYCSTEDGGVLSLAGSTGAIAWWRPLPGLPRDLDCSLIDVNDNGVFDCIVVGDNGLLEAIDPVTGVVLWHVHIVNALERVVDLAFPLILPDLDGDGVGELLASCRVVGESFSSVVSEHNNLALVSGKTGRIIGRPYRVSMCSRIHSLRSHKHLSVSYVCQNDIREESFKTISLQVLYTLITNQAIVTAPHLKTTTSEYKQHPANVGDNPVESNGHVINGRRLTVENRGHCPLCDVDVRITDERPGRESIVWNYTSLNTHAMLPVPLTISNVTMSNDTSLPGTIHGFVLKFWQWINIVDEGRKAAERTLAKTPIKSRRTSSEEFIANQIRSSVKTVYSYTSIHQLQERTVLITLSDVGVDMSTVSRHNITQLCSHVGNKDMICQPDLAFQEQSLLIADLGLDGEHELVSFFSTYESGGPDEVSRPWFFRSEVHVIPLESELLVDPAN